MRELISSHVNITGPENHCEEIEWNKNMINIFIIGMISADAPIPLVFGLL